MPHNRYFIDAPFERDGSLLLEGDEWHHLVRVHRAKKGDRVELVNGRGQLALSRVTELNKHDAGISIEEIMQEQTPPPALILAQAIPRMNHLEWIIEKGTELNVTEFWLFPGSLSEKEDLSPTQKARLKHLSVAAMKQCGRLDLPEIVLKPHLSRWPKTEGTLLFGDTSEDAPWLWDLSPDLLSSQPVIIFIGPEKGFSQKEHTCLTETLSAKGVRLHPNILRAETAPLVALSLIQKYL